MPLSPKAYLKNWPFARVNLGMSKGEFLSLTPVEWAEIANEWDAREERENRRTARVMMAMCGGSEDDYMPRPPLTPEQQDELILNQFLNATAKHEHIGDKPDGR